MQQPTGVEGTYVQQGQELLFEHYVDEGPMWAGYGERATASFVEFDRPYVDKPVVHVSISLLDVQTDPLIRYELTAENITSEGFEIIFKTWADSRFARVRVAWLAIGQAIRDEYWVDF